MIKDGNDKIRVQNWISFNEDRRRQEEERLKKLSEKPKVSTKEKSEKNVMIAKAAEFVENGIPFDMAPQELQNHHFFKVGYEIALRKQKISNGLKK